MWNPLLPLTQNLIAETETEIKGNNPKFNYQMLTPGSRA